MIAVIFVLIAMVVYLLLFQYQRDKILNEVKLAHGIPMTPFLRISWLTCVNAILIALVMKGALYAMFDGYSTAGAVLLLALGVLMTVAYQARKDVMKHLCKQPIDVGMEEKTILKVYKILLFKDMASTFIIFAVLSWLVH